MTPSELSEHYIRILPRVVNKRWIDDQSFTGDFVLEDVVLDSILALVEESCIAQILIDNSSISFERKAIEKHLGDTLSIEFVLPKPNDSLAIVKNIDSLLLYKQFLTQTPTNVFFVEDCSTELPQPYSDVVMLAFLLKATSDHYEVINQELNCYYYDGVKISVPIRFTSTDLSELNSITTLAESFSDGPRLKEKIRLFKAAVVKIAISAPSENLIFPHIIQKFSHLKATFDQDWALYVSDFSLDEVLDELEEKILKIAEKLSSALSDLQRSLIAIPIAIIFAATRFDTNNIYSDINILILICVWVFASFTWAFFYNHKRTLSFIDEEIKDQKIFISDKHAGIAHKVSPKFKILEDRSAHQHSYRKIVGSIMWLCVLSLTFTLLFFPIIMHLIQLHLWKTEPVIYLTRFHS